MATTIETSTKKQLPYRGKEIEELKSLSVREFSKYLKSRTRRAVLRQFQDIEDFISRAKKKTSKNKPIRTHKRTIIVVPQMIGMKISVYNGHEFMPVEITSQMLGHRLGEFAPTRGKVKHSGAIVGILPILGPSMLGIPVAIFLLIGGNSFAAIGILIFTLISSLSDHIFRPLLVSRRTRLHNGIVLVGMVGGFLLFGVLGFILGPLILAYLIIIIEVYRNKPISSILIKEGSNK